MAAAYTETNGSWGVEGGTGSEVQEVARTVRTVPTCESISVRGQV